MKKIILSIPEPCHESWEQMSPCEKGKFCIACQKTVVDFRGMSDRQVAEFFKRTAGSVCGHVNAGQLNRFIDLPKKRIPWVKYFFQFTWPAFMLFLKSCGYNERTIGKIHVESPKTVPEEKSVHMVEGFVLITDSAKSKKTEKSIKPAPIAVNRVEVIVEESSEQQGASDSLINNLEKFPVVKPDVIPNVAQPPLLCGRVGGLSIQMVSVSPVRSVKDSVKNFIDAAFKKFFVYPNPVQANSIMKIDLKKLEAGEYTISIINMAGEVVQTDEVKIQNKNTLVDLQLEETAAGTYLIHVFNRKTAASYTEKIVVQ